jgi:hypothetical protein
MLRRKAAYQQQAGGSADRSYEHHHQLYVGDDPKPSPGTGRGGGTGWITVMYVAIALLLALLAVATIAASTHYWIQNVQRIDTDVAVGHQHIAVLQSSVALLNATMPEGNGTVFFDDNWWMASGIDHSRQFQLNASLVPPGETLNYALPNVSGIVVLEETLRPPLTEFPEDQFAIVGSPASSAKRVEFSLDLLGPGTTRELRVPNKDGVVATLDDVVTIAGNTSVFLDSAFILENDPDTTKRVRFDASAITSGVLRVYSLPDLDGTVLLTSGLQSVSQKILDSTNVISVLDGSGFTIEGLSGTARFDASLLTGARVYAYPDFGGVYVLTAGAQTLSDKTLDSSNTIEVLDSGLTIIGSAAVPAGSSFQFDGSLLTASRLYETPDFDGTFVLTAGAQTLSDKILDTSNAITVLSTQFAIEDAFSGDQAIFDTDALTDTRLYTLPNKDGVFALLDDVHTIAGNTSVFFDVDFILEHVNDPSRQAHFDAGLIDPGTNHTFSFPNLSGEFALTTGAQTLQDKTLDISNSATLLDTEFFIEGIESGETARFNVSALTAPRVYRLPDQGGRFLILPNPSPGSGYVEPLWSDPLESMRVPDTGFFVSSRTDQTRQVRFSADGVSGGTTRVVSLPDLSGEAVLTTGAQTIQDKTLDVSNHVSLYDNRFTLVESVSGIFGVQFDLDGITFNRLVHLPDKDGTVAYLDDVHTIAGNTSVFFDVDFILEHVNDPSRQAHFDAGLIDAGTNHTFSFPNLSGELVLTTGVQTIQEKSLDTTNDITVLDAMFTVEGTLPGRFQFDASVLTDFRTYRVPDQSGGFMVLPIPGPPTKRSNHLTDPPDTTGLVEPIWSNENVTALFRGSGIALVHDLNPESQIMFRADMLGSGLRRHIYVPDANGEMVLRELEQALRNKVMGPTNNIALYDHRFHIIFDDGAGTGNVARFDASGLSANRTLVLPDADDTLATLSDVMTIAANTSVFDDADFVLLHHNDQTRQAHFDAGLIPSGTSHTFLFPPIEGEFVVREGFQIISGKELDNTNAITVLDTSFLIEGGTGGSMDFVADALTGFRSFALPDTSMTLVGRNGDHWNYESLDMEGGADSYNAIALEGTGVNPRSRFFRFHTAAAARAGIAFSEEGSGSQLHLFASDDRVQFAHKPDGTPSTASDLGTPVLSVAETVRLHHAQNASWGVEWDVGATTGMRELAAPDASGTILLEEHAQTVSNKEIDNSNTIAVLDENLSIEGAGGVLRFDAGDLTATRTLTAPNKDGVIATMGDVQDLVEADNTFLDGVFTIENSQDTTKKAMVDASGISTDTTRTYALPDSDMTLVGSDLSGFVHTWDYKSLGMETESAAAASFIALRGDANVGINRFFSFQSASDDSGYGGILLTGVVDEPMLSPVGVTYALVVAENSLRITKRSEDGVPPAIPMVDNTLLSFPNDQLRLHRHTNNDHWATLVTSGLTGGRSLEFPDLSGTFALTSGAQTLSEKTLDSSNTVAKGALPSDVVYEAGEQTLTDKTIIVLDEALVIEGGSGEALRFDASMLTAPRTLTAPNKDGVIATMGDVQDLVEADNTFLDGVFTIENTQDTSKKAMVDASGISTDTTRTYALPDMNGAFALTSGAQTLSDKTLDSSNTVVKGALPSDTVYETGAQTISDKTLDASNTVAKGALPSDTVYETGAQTLSQKTLDNSNTIAILDENLSIEGAGGVLRFGADDLTATRTLTAPNKDGVIATMGDVQDLVEADNTFLDGVFTIENTQDTTKKAMVDASGISTDTTRTYVFPDMNGAFALTSGAQTLSQKTLDSSNTVVKGALPSDTVYETGAQTISDKTLDASNTIVKGALPSDTVYETGAQTISDKTLDNSNTITVPDDALTIEGGAGSVQFDGANLSLARTYELPDTSMTLLGRNGNQIDYTAWDMNSDDYNEIVIESSGSSDRYVRFSRAGGGKAGITLTGNPGQPSFRMDHENGVLTFSRSSNDPVIGEPLGGARILTVSNRVTFRNAARAVTWNVDQTTTERTVTAVDSDGTMVLEAYAQTLSNKEIDNTNTIAVEDENLSIEGAGGVLRFDAGDLTALRTLTAPNKDGVIATMGDVQDLVEADNTFLDGVFTIENTQDTTKKAMVDASGISTDTTRTYALPDMNGAFALTDGAQTISDKTLDSSNTVVKGALPSDTVYETGAQTISDKTLDASNTVAAGALPLDVVYETGSQTISDKNLDNSNTVADGALSNNVVKRNGDSWNLQSLGLTTVGNITDFVTLPASSSINRFFRFRSAGSTRGRAGIHLSEFDNTNYHLFTADGEYQITFTNSLPSTWDDLANAARVFTIGGGDRRTRLHQFSNDANYAEWDVNALTAPRVLAAPDLAGTFALTDGAQTISDKTLDASNTVADGALSNNVIKRSGGNWDDASTGMDGAGANQLRLVSGDGVSKFFGFRKGFSTSETGITLQSYSGNFWHHFANTNGLNWHFSGTAPATALDYGAPIMRLDRVTKRLRLFDGDNSAKIAEFDPSGVSTLRSFAFPDLAGTFALTDGAQTISDKNLDSSNTVVKGALPLDVVYETGSQTISDKNIDNSNTVADGALSNNIVKRTGNNFVLSSLGMGATNNVTEYIQLTASDNRNRFFRFRTGGGTPVGMSGILLSEFDTRNFYMYARSGQFQFRYRNSLATTYDDLNDDATRVITIPQENRHVRFHQSNGDDSYYVEWDVSELTGQRTLTAPNKDGVIATIGDIQDIVESDNTFLDGVFTIENSQDTTKKAMVDASGISTDTTRTYAFPDSDMTLVGSDLSGFVHTWDYKSLGMETESATAESSITLRGDSSAGINRFFAFQSASDDSGYGGILLRGVVDEPFMSPVGITYALVVAENTLRLTKRSEDGVPPDVPMVSHTILSFPNDQLRLHRHGTNAHSATFVTSALTGQRNLAIQDKGCTIACMDDVEANSVRGLANYWRQQPVDIRNQGSSAVTNVQDVTWSPENALFVTVGGHFGGSNRAASSPDGLVWTAVSTPGQNSWGAVTWSSDLDLFVAVAREVEEEGAPVKRARGGADKRSTGFDVATSPDGETWTARETPFDTGGFTAVIWVSALTKFVAMGDRNGVEVALSSDGITWTEHTVTPSTGNNFFWKDVVWSAKHQLLVAVGREVSVGGRVMTSADGETWALHTPPDFRWRGVAWSPEQELFVAVGGSIGDGQVMTSSDGVSWTLGTEAPTNILWEDVEWVPQMGLFVVVGGDGVTETDRIISSADGIKWDPLGSPNIRNWIALAWAPEIFTVAMVGHPNGFYSATFPMSPVAVAETIQRDWNRYSAYRFHSSGATFSSSTTVIVPMNQLLFDPSGAMSSNGLYTCPEDGLYEATLQIHWNANNIGQRMAMIFLSVNNGAFNNIATWHNHAYTEFVPHSARTSTLRVLSEGDRLEPRARQDSQQGLGFANGVQMTYFYVRYLGPV